MTTKPLTKCPVTDIMVRDTACFECKFWRKWAGRDTQHECKYNEIMTAWVERSRAEYKKLEVKS